MGKKLNDLADATQSLLLTEYMTPSEAFGSLSHRLGSLSRFFKPPLHWEWVQSGRLQCSSRTAQELTEFLLETTQSTFGVSLNMFSFSPGNFKQVVRGIWSCQEICAERLHTHVKPSVSRT